MLQELRDLALAAAQPGPALPIPEVLILAVQAFAALGAVQGPAGTQPLRDARDLEGDLRGLRQAAAAALIEVRLNPVAAAGCDRML